jgi:two-component system, chemotaxis family, chemotaxis protein CheY
MTAPLLLVVEDDPDIREALSVVLRDAGYGIRAAVDGFDAIEALRRGPRPSAILLDLMMPGMNGYEFREEQRADPAIADIPVIVITATRWTERAAAQLGAVACVPKPAQVEDLIAAVARVAGPVN